MKVAGGLVEFSCGVIVADGDIKSLLAICLAIRARELAATRMELHMAKLLTHGIAYGMQWEDMKKLFKCEH